MQPVQRITRLPLLIREVIKATVKLSPEQAYIGVHPHLDTACTELENVHASLGQMSICVVCFDISGDMVAVYKSSTSIRN